MSDEEMIKITSKLFQVYVNGEGIEPKMYPKVSVLSFMKWMHDAGNINSFELAAELDIEPDKIDNLRHAIESPMAANVLMPMWPHIIFGKRANKHPLKAFCLMMLMQWEDGVIGPLSAYGNKDITRAPLNDATVMSVMNTYPPQMALQLTNKSLDEMHDKCLPNQGLFEADVFVALEDAINLSSANRDLKERMSRLVGFAAAMLPPRLPENVEDTFSSSQPPSDPPDGWNVPKPGEQQ